MSIDLLLASSSPRRRELLQQLGVRFGLVRGDIDESVRPGESPDAYVQRLALEKARAGWNAAVASDLGAGCPVLGADTSVVVDGEVVGKPQDSDQSVATLARLSGRTHQVMTAVALVQGARADHVLCCTDVTFRDISPAEALAYWQTGEPADKAGAYGIQGRGAVFVRELRGSYTGVVGLPLFETAELLKLYDVPVWL